MITVLCVWVRGPVPFTADYVGRLERMVRRYLPQPFRFVCLTDRPGAFAHDPRIEVVRITAPEVPHNGRGFWAKVQLFDPVHQWTGRVVFLDLDVLIVGDLEPVVATPSAFALITDPWTIHRRRADRDQYGRQIVRRFNSSVMVWDGGTQTEICTAWTPAAAVTYSTDQDWMAVCRPDAVGMPLAWFPRISQLVTDPIFAARGAPMPPEARVILCKKPKNHEAIRRWPWLNTAWGGWAA